MGMKTDNYAGPGALEANLRKLLSAATITVTWEVFFGRDTKIT